MPGGSEAGNEYRSPRCSGRFSNHKTDADNKTICGGNQRTAVSSREEGLWVLLQAEQRREAAAERADASLCVPSMALILLVQVQSRVFTAKCSEPQAGVSNGMGEGSGVAKFLSLRKET